MKLAELQRSFQAHVLYQDPAIGTQIVVDERCALSLRLGVYTGAYATRLVEVLAESFPAVHEALGARLFERSIRSFVRERPSRVRSARDYGAELPAWLATHLAGPRAAGIADLARFEWAVAGAFDAADQATLGPAGLAAFDAEQWARLQFAFSPTLRRLSVTSNAVAWWKCACAQQPRPSRWRTNCAQQWLVWRRELAVYYRRLSQAETRALDAALAGTAFGQLCVQLHEAGAAAGLLHGWLTEGLIVGASIGP